MMLDDGRDFTMLAGFLLMALAGAVVVTQPRQATYRALGLLLAVCGVRYALVGWDGAVHSTPFAFAVFAIIAIPFAVLNFALVMENAGRVNRGVGSRAVLLAALLFCEGLYFWKPDWFLGSQGLVALVDVFNDLAYVAYASIALFFVLLARRSPGAIRRNGLLMMSAGFALQPAMWVALRLGLLGAPIWFNAGGVLMGLAIVMASFLLAAVAAQVAKLAFGGGRTEITGRARRYLLAMAAPVACGLGVEALSNLSPGTFGLERPHSLALDLLFIADAFWQLILILTVSFALLRYQVFGIEQQAKRGAHFASAGIVLAMVYGVVAVLSAWVGLEGGVERHAAAGGVVALLLVPVYWSLGRVAEWFMPGVAATPAYLEARRIQLYRNEVEEVLSDGLLMEAEHARMAEARERYGLSAQEAEAVMDEVVEQLPPLRRAHFPLLGDRRTDG